MYLAVRCEFRVAKASINVPSPGAYPISDISDPSGTPRPGLSPPRSPARRPIARASSRRLREAPPPSILSNISLARAARFEKSRG